MPAQSLMAGRYALEECLGAGRSGAVHRAYDRASGRTVALKSAPPAPGGRSAGVRKEFRILAAVRHPHLVEAFAFSEDRELGLEVLALELVEGLPLDRAARRLGPGAAADLLLQAARALVALHAAGWVHGDVKPANLLVTGLEREVPRLVVIDLSHAGRSGEGRRGVVRGTPRYAAASVLDGRPPTFQSDLFALGASFQEAWTGRIDGRDEDEAETDEARAMPLDVQRVLSRLVTEDEDARFPDAARVVRTLAPLARYPAGPPDARPIDAAFVGRESELAELGAALERVRSGGAGELFFVTGEAGIGKSRLLEEVRTRALLAGFRGARSRCRPEAGAPFAPWHELVRRLSTGEGEDGEALRLVERLAAPARGDSFEDELSTEVEQALGRIARRAPLLLLVEDAQWMDGPAARVLLHLARRASPGTLILAAVRDGPDRAALPCDPAAGRVLGLGRLGAEQTADLAGSVFDMGPPSRGALLGIAASTEGHPEFAEEGARRVAADWWSRPGVDLEMRVQSALPNSLAAAYADELGALAPEELRVARALGVLGSHGDEDLVAALCTEDADAGRHLGRLIRRGVVRREGGLALRSETLRRILLERTEEAERVRFHRRACAAWLLRPDDLERAEAVALHALGCADHGLALEHGTVAVERLALAHRSGRAIDLAERLLALDGAEEAELGARLLEALGDARFRTGDGPQAREIFARALSRACAGEPGGGPLRLERKLAAATEVCGELEVAHSSLARALERALPDIADPAELARSHDLLGKLAFRLGRLPEAERWLRAGLHALSASGEAEGCPEASLLWNDLGILAFQVGDYARSEAHHRRALSIRERHGDAEGRNRSLTNLGNVAMVRGRFADARACYVEALELKRRLGNQASIALTVSNLALLDHVAGRFGEAIHGLEEALEVRERLSDRHGEIHGRRNLAEVWLDKGELGQARTQASRAVELARLSQEQDTVLAAALVTLARVETAVGRIDAALVLAREAATLATALGGPSEEGLARTAMAEALRALPGRLGEASEEAFRGLGLLRRTGDPLHVARGLLVAADVALDAVRLDEAERDAGEALDLAERLGVPLQSAMARLLLGRVALGRRRWAEVSRTLHGARTEAERMGAPELAWRVYAAFADFHGVQGRRERAVLWLGRCVGVFREAVRRLDAPQLEASYLETLGRARVLAHMAREVSAVPPR